MTLDRVERKSKMNTSCSLSAKKKRAFYSTGAYSENDTKVEKLFMVQVQM